MKNVIDASRVWLRAGALPALHLFLAGAHAQQAAPDSHAPAADEIIVTATRSAQDVQTAPLSATIITRAQIAASGAQDANEAIRKIAGVVARGDLTGGREYTLDLRGFGDASVQNTVVLVDGVRISEMEQAAARLSAIDAQHIERIEIVRGGASVMWGEGASAGVIHIITRTGASAGTSTTATLAAESFDTHEASADLRFGTGNLKLNGSVRSRQTEGYRLNSAARQDVLALGLHAVEGDTTVRARLAYQTSAYRLPGALTYAQYAADRTYSTHLRDWGALDQTQFSAGIEHHWGDWVFSADVGSSTRSATSYYYSSFSPNAPATHVHSGTTQLSPRVTHEAKFDGLQLRTAVGIDSLHWTYDKDRAYDANSNVVARVAAQQGQAFYAMTDWLFDRRTRVVVGGRLERIEKTATDTGTKTTPYQLSNALNAHEVALNRTLDAGVDAYVRSAKSYRMGNVDDYTATSTAVALRPQVSRDKEIGVKWRAGHASATARYFIQNTLDEIYYDPSANSGYGANVNIAPTRRSGVELSGSHAMSPRVRLSATWQYLQAQFRGGANAGKRIPLTNSHAATLRMSYQIDPQQSLESAWRHLGDARVGSDEANTCARTIAAVTVLDAQYRWRSGDRAGANAGNRSEWEFSLGASNLTNRKYYTYDYNYGCGSGGLYPELPRALSVGLHYHF